MNADEPPEPKFFGPFEVLAKIGRGGNGNVYKVRHRDSGEVAALKVGRGLLQLLPNTLERFRLEFSAIQPLQHPNLVRALAWGEQNSFQYLAMEYVPGQNLEDRLKEKGRLEPQEAASVFLQLADGLSYLHDNLILHRDIKPGNVFLTPDNRAKLGDFGLLKNLLEDAHLTQSRQGMGTIEYGAPEQFEDAKRADERCDFYSFAATLYSALTGKFPFGNGSHMQIMQRKFLNQFVPLNLLIPDLEPGLNDLVNACLRSDPAQRPGQCAELIGLLRGAQGSPRPKTSARSAAESLPIDGGERRARVRFAIDLTATFVPFHQNMRGRWNATILDASPEGVRLQTPRPVAVNSVLQITLGQSGRTELALVRWVKQAEKDAYIAGCSFIRPLTREDFEQLYPSTSKGPPEG